MLSINFLTWFLNYVLIFVCVGLLFTCRSKDIYNKSFVIMGNRFITTIKFDCIHWDELNCIHVLCTDETDCFDKVGNVM